MKSNTTIEYTSNFNTVNDNELVTKKFVEDALVDVVKSEYSTTTNTAYKIWVGSLTEFNAMPTPRPANLISIII